MDPKHKRDHPAHMDLIVDDENAGHER
jgi:hypothetical protein